MTRRLLALAVLVAAAVFAPPAQAQFGQNKVNWDRFPWQVYRSPHFDVYHYLPDDRQLQEVVSEAESAYLDLSRALDHELTGRVPLLLYRTHSDFEQTNVTPGEVGEAVGAFAEPFQNRMVLPIDSPPDMRYKLIRHELTHIFEFDILFGNSLRRAIRGQQTPTWLMEGLASYLGDDEQSFDQMVIRDAVVNNLVPSVKQLDVLSYMTYRYGHAIFDFIARTWGKEGIRTFLFEYRKGLLAHNLEKVFKDAFGLTVDAFDRRYARYLRERYLPVLTGKRAPEEYGPEIGLTKPGRYTFSPVLSPSGDLIAALATPKLKLDVVILSAKDGKLIRNLTPRFTDRWEEVSTEAFSGKRDLAWSADGDRLAFFVKKEKWRPLVIFDPRTGRQVGKAVFKDIAACASPAFSPDGRYIAFSGNRDGVWDIFRYDLETKTVENLTQDEYYDSNPVFSADGKTLLYNRRIGAFEKIFSVEVGAPQKKVQLTAGAASDIQPIYSRDGKTIFFSSDRGEYGVYNVHRLDVATGAVTRVTDLVGGAFAPVEMAAADDGAPQLAYSAFQGLTFRLYKMKLTGAEVERAAKAGAAEPASSPLAASRRAVAAKPAEEPKPPAAAQPAQETRPADTTKPVQEVPPAQVPPKADAESAKPAPPATDAEANADLRPFKPPLDLRLDPEKKGPYKPTFSLDQPSIGVGVTDTGTFLSDVTLHFTDLLGDQRISVRAYSIADYSNIQLGYLNLSHRFHWGVQLFDYRDYYVVGNSSGYTSQVQQRQRYTMLGGMFEFPFSRKSRLEGSLFYVQRRFAYPNLSPTGVTNVYNISFTSYADDFPQAELGLVTDTVRYASFGPFQGHRARVAVSAARYTAGDHKGSSLIGYQADLRVYQHVTARSLFAARLQYTVQNGDAPNIYALGGMNQLRGFDFREFFGSQVALANVEFRFPLFDSLRFGFGYDLGPVRGFVFADAGTTWFEKERYPIFDDQGYFSGIGYGRAVYDERTGYLRGFSTWKDGALQDIHVAAGIGLNFQFLGWLPFNWSFSRVFDGHQFGPYHSAFYIVWDW